MPSLGPLVAVAVSGRRRGGGGHPAGDRLDRRRGPLRAPPAGAGALHLRPDPGHRVRPGGRRPARRADRLACDLVVLGVAHIGAGLLLLGEMRRLSVGVPVAARPRWARRRRRPSRVLRQPWVRIVLGTTFLEGMVMFGAFAYVGAELHQRFGLEPRRGRRHAGIVRRRRADLLAATRRHAGAALGQPGLAAGGACCSPPATPCWPACRGCGLRRPPSPSSASASTCCTTRCRPTPRRWRPRRAGLPVSLFAFVLFTRPIGGRGSGRADHGPLRRAADLLVAAVG